MSESEIKQILVAIAKVETILKSMEDRFASGSRRFESIEATQKQSEKDAAGAHLKLMMRVTVIEDTQKACSEASGIRHAQREVILKDIQEKLNKLAPMHWAYSLVKVAAFLGAGAWIANYVKLPIKWLNLF